MLHAYKVSATAKLITISLTRFRKTLDLIKEQYFLKK